MTKKERTSRLQIVECAMLGVLVRFAKIAFCRGRLWSFVVEYSSPSPWSTLIFFSGGLQSFAVKDWSPSL